MSHLGMLAASLALALSCGAVSAAAEEAAAPGEPAPSCIGKARLRGQTFGTGTAAIADEVKPVLDLIATAIKDNCGGRRITIEGHSDTRGGAESNQELSERRAEAVKAYLVAQGVPADQLSTVGYGETQPLSATDHELNRRVTFLVEASSGSR
jgi:OOP family OmpA-OmpF porin